MVQIEKYLLFILFLSISPFTYCQIDTSSIAQDSIENRVLLRQSLELQKLQLTKLADSIRKAELEEQLLSLKSTDELTKNSLKKELQQLKSKDSLRVLRQKKKIDSLRTIVKGYPVAPFADTLFFIYTRSGSFSPKERAEAISLRIKSLNDDYAFSGDSLRIVPSDHTTDIIYGENVVIGISDEDALWQNSTKDRLARSYKEIISEAIAHYRQETSWQTVAKEIALALLVILVVALIIFLTGKFFLWLKGKVIAQEGILIKGIKVKGYQLFTSEKEVSFILSLLTIVKWLVVILIIYLALPVLFGIFPRTEGLANTLLDYFLNPLKKILKAVWDYFPNLITILVIATVFRYVLKGLHFLKNELKRGALHINGFYSDWAEPTYQLLRVLVLAFMMIVIFPYMPGSDSPIFKGVSVFLGVLFTFGSAGALGNVVAGLVLTYMRAFKIGDRVKIGEVTGDIIERSLLVTRIRTIKNEIISIPNSTVMGSHTINFSSDATRKGLIVYTTVTIGYDVPWRKVHQLLTDAALATELIDTEPLPFVLQTSLDDYYVSYQLNAYTRHPNKQAIIYSLLHQNIQDRFNEAEIEIMSPHYRAMRDGNTTTIPPDYLPPDYTPPSFNVRQAGERTDD